MRYGDILEKLIKKDNRFFILTAENMGPIYYIMDKVRENYLDVGISEQTMIGIASGLALRGRIPIVHAMSAFLLMRPFEFIRTDIGYGNLNVKLVGTAAGFFSEKNGATHQCIEDIALMRSIPNMHIYAPADNDDMLKMEMSIMTESNPSYLRYNDIIRSYNHEEFKLGKAEIIGDGEDIVIITYGMLFHQCMIVKEKLEQEMKKVSLINLRSIVPLDEDTILQSAKKCKKMIVVEDHLAEGGMYDVLCKLLVKNKIIVDILPINLKKYFKPGRLEEILNYEGFSAQKLVDKINIFLNKGEKI